MKPLKLTFSAFGAYPGTETVDFESLYSRGLFLVSGPTGAGKSTIFDAMCWALYGDMPLKHKAEVRSDFVPAETQTKVTFDFEVGGVRYTVVRNPDQLRPALRGSRTVTEAAAAVLIEHRDGGTVTRASKVNEVAKEIEALIGLSAQQFQRVVLLPQGDFAQFLLASSTERESLLSKLFGGEVYDVILSELKSGRDQLRDQLGNQQTKVEGELKQARRSLGEAHELLEVELDHDEGYESLTPVKLESLLEPLSEAVLTQQTVVVGLKKTLDGQRHQLNIAVQAEQRFTDYRRYTDELSKLDARREAVLANKASALQSQKARLVIEAVRKANEAHRVHLQSSERVAKRRAQLHTALVAAGVAIPAATASAYSQAFHAAKAELQGQRQLLNNLLAAQTRLFESQEALKKLRLSLNESNERCRLLSERHEQLKVKEGTLRGLVGDPVQLESVIKRYEQLSYIRETYDHALAQMVVANTQVLEAEAESSYKLQAFVDSQAPRLAKALIPEEPCPVCGSITHPSPATAVESAVASYEDVETTRQAAEAARAGRDHLGAEIAGLRAQLGEAVSVEASELTRQLADYRTQQAKLLKRLRELDELESLLQTLGQEVQAEDQAVLILGERISQAENGHNSANQDLEVATTAAMKIEPLLLDEKEFHLDQVGELLSGFDRLESEVALHSERASAAAEARDSALEASGFSQVSAAEDALVEITSENAWMQEAEDHHLAEVQTHALLQELEKLGVPATPPDLASLNLALAETEAKYDDEAERSHQAKVHEDGVHGALKRYHDLVSANANLQSSFDHASKVYQVCNEGGTALAMPLKRWVLAGELDQVTQAANLHLQEMTSNRYSLLRKTEPGDRRFSFGLDIEVFDANTGKARSTRSLSGGEAFQASLALALGLADVVSRGGNSSGHDFEALFIDEGFGSLSEEALADAVATLYQLQNSGRMVGVISHVESMKQDLHVGIEVQMRTDGRGSTLVVSP